MTNLTELAFRRFGERGWDRYDSLIREGRLTLEEGARAQYEMLRADSVDDFLEVVHGHDQLREGFVELVESCGEVGVPLVIASFGLDFIIDYFLRKHGLFRVPVICPRFHLGADGLRVEFPPRFSDMGRGDFKDGLVRYLKERDDTVIYVGNGLSDMNAASRSDRAFVVQGLFLETECVARGHPSTPIGDFWPVTETVREQVG